MGKVTIRTTTTTRTVSRYAGRWGWIILWTVLCWPVALFLFVVNREKITTLIEEE